MSFELSGVVNQLFEDVGVNINRFDNLKVY